MGPVVKGSFANDVYDQSAKFKLNLTDFRLILLDRITNSFPQMKQMEAKMRQQEKRNKPFIPPKEPAVSTSTSKPSTDTSIDIDAFKAKIKKNTKVRKQIFHRL